MYNNKKPLLHSEITDKILNAFYFVSNKLGYGFLEKVYKNALLIKLREFDLKVIQQKNIKVFFEGKVVGDYFADLIINDKVIVELKVAENLCDEHYYQLVNYLKATNKEVGLLLNFGKEPHFKRAIFTNDRK